MICPNCNSNDISLKSIESKKANKVERKSSSKGCLYWLFIGWWWELFLLFFIKIPIALIQLLNDLLTAKKTEVNRIAKCQTCGFSWKHIPQDYSTSSKSQASESAYPIGNKIIVIAISVIIGLCFLVFIYNITVQSLRSIGFLPTPIFTSTSTATVTQEPTITFTVTSTQQITNTPSHTKTPTSTVTPRPPESLEEQIYQALIEPLGENTIHKVIISEGTLQVNTNLDRDHGMVAFYSEIGVIHGVIVRANPSVNKVVLNDVIGQTITMPMDAMIRYYQKSISWEEFRDTWEISSDN